MQSDESKKIIKRIQLTGTIGRGICTFAIGLLLLVAVLVLAVAVLKPVDLLEAMQCKPMAWKLVQGELPSRVLVVSVIESVILAIAAFFWLLRRIFVDVAANKVISHGNARRVKLLGLLILAGGVLNHLELVAILSGMLMMVFGWTLQLTVELQEEQALVI